MLLERGADLDARDRDGRVARSVGKTEVAEMLDKVTPRAAEERRRVWEAARPWSVSRHLSFGPAVRRRAVFLLVVGRRLANGPMAGFAGAGEAFLKWWADHGVDYVLDPWGRAATRAA